jgi:DNA modification methylase
LPAQSVQTCVTSPPYWGLRCYGHDSQIGLEATPDAYVAQLVAVFREVRRVLKDDGTVWLNLGDSYAGSGPSGASYQSETTKRRSEMTTDGAFRISKTLAARGLTYAEKKPIPPLGLKPKDLCGIPWRVAFALQADGWYLRSDIIWSKPNPMPESVTDRPTKAHEYLFLLAKQATYFYDVEAIREEQSGGAGIRGGIGAERRPDDIEGVWSGRERLFKNYPPEFGRNKRSVWHVATQPYPDAHFATFPEALIEPCILAGTSEKGECPQCGKAWERMVERQPMEVTPTVKRAAWQAVDDKARTQVGGTMTKPPSSQTLGWQPTCTCDAGDPVPQTVLDPFSGSGTTGAVAVRHQRNFVGCELNPAYVELARKRIGAVAPLFAEERTA